MKKALKVLADCGAVLVRASIPTAGWIGGPGTAMNVLNRNPLSRNKGNLATPSVVFVYELKRDLNLYLRDWAAGTDQDHGRHRRLQPGQRGQGAALRPGSLPRRRGHAGDLSELEYRSARAMDLLHARTRGLDAYMAQHKLDAVVFPGMWGWRIAAKAGYPSVQVPAGMRSGVDGKETPDFPLGLTFTGRAWSEARSCGWPTPTSRLPRRAGRRRDCRRFSCLRTESRVPSINP